MLKQTVEVKELCECMDCGYKGNKGLWVGYVIMENGDVLPFKRLVIAKEEDDGMFDLQPIVDFYVEAKKMEVETITGEAYCPKCHSNMFF